MTLPHCVLATMTSDNSKSGVYATADKQQWHQLCIWITPRSWVWRCNSWVKEHSSQSKPNFNWVKEHSSRSKPNFNWAEKHSSRSKPNFNWVKKHSSWSKPNFNWTEEHSSRSKPNFNWAKAATCLSQLKWAKKICGSFFQQTMPFKAKWTKW